MDLRDELPIRVHAHSVDDIDGETARCDIEVDYLDQVVVGFCQIIKCLLEVFCPNPAAT